MASQATGEAPTYVSEGKLDGIVLDTIDAAAGEYSAADYKRLLRKIDIILLPLMWFCYGTQQAAKTSISNQATFEMIKDTKFVGQQFSWLSTAFYFAYPIGKTPGNF
ncbi:major facilitator superfamily transporter [Colletotrichum asianum]|uniref:Major facilitator superfamily transporter n=1 Tax=Colletotrichum asianum TaxID=702518 RepID=A0A8H3WMI3_9PEZI|nr:major facilitator superfamily transporter [Colletotrichum asianum]